MTLCRKFIVLPFLLISAHQPLALEIDGPWIQGGMILGKTAPANQIRFLKRQVRINPQGQFVVGLGRDAPAQVTLVEIFPNGLERAHNFSVVQRSYKEQRIEGVPKHTVQVPEAQLPRIRKEAALVRQARRTNSLRSDFLGEFTWPTKGIISGVYGSRRIYNGEPRRPHFGVDIAAPEGSLVWSPVAGRVTLVHEDMYFSGGTLIIDHGHGISSTFIHLAKVLVQKGDEVKQGQPIAEVGATGRATGPHLDWRINWFEQRLDPQLLIDSLPEKD